MLWELVSRSKKQNKKKEEEKKSVVFWWVLREGHSLASNIPLQTSSYGKGGLTGLLYLTTAWIEGPCYPWLVKEDVRLYPLVNLERNL